MSNEEFLSFPPIHQRVVPLTEADSARIEMTNLLRELIRETFVSIAHEDDMTQAIGAVRDALQAVKRQSGHPEGGAFTSNFLDRSPFMGLMNPLAPPMTAWLEKTDTEHGEICGRVVFSEPYEGPPGHVHGGYIAAVFDEVLGQAQSLSGRPGMTGRLSVSYRSPTPLFEELRLRGWIDRIEGRKIFTHGTLHHGETLCAEAEGLFISMPAEYAHLLRKGRDAGGGDVVGGPDAG